MLNFDISTVKHGTQNSQNDCHQWLSDSFRVHQIRFRPGLRLGPRWGSLQRSPDPPAGLRGPTSKVDGKKRGKGERRGDEWKGRDRPPLSQISGSAPGRDRPIGICANVKIRIVTLLRSLLMYS